MNQHYLTQGWWSRHRWNHRGRWHHAGGHRRHRRWPWSHWGHPHGWKWWWDPRRRHLGRRKETYIPVPKAEYTLGQPQMKSQSSSITLQEGCWYAQHYIFIILPQLCATDILDNDPKATIYLYKLICRLWPLKFMEWTRLR